MIYQGDSLCTLSPAQIAGVLAVSTAMAAPLFWIVGVGLRSAPVWLRLTAALFCFAAYLWLSPQGHYTYYRLIIEGLPAQIVIKQPPTPASLITLLTLSGPATLAAHGSALLGWALIATALLRRQKAPRGGKNPRH